MTAERGRRRWSLQAVEAPGAISEVNRLSQAAEYMREIGTILEVSYQRAQQLVSA